MQPPGCAYIEQAKLRQRNELARELHDGTALAAVATRLGARKPRGLAQIVQQQPVAGHGIGAFSTVEGQFDNGCHRGAFPGNGAASEDRYLE